MGLLVGGELLTKLVSFGQRVLPTLSTDELVDRSDAFADGSARIRRALLLDLDAQARRFLLVAEHLLHVARQGQCGFPVLLVDFLMDGAAEGVAIACPIRHLFGAVADELLLAD